MLRFTLDTNCVIDVDEQRKDAAHIMALARAHADKQAEVAVVAIMASEKQRAGGYLETFDLFQARLNRLGLGHLDLALPLGFWGIGYWGRMLWSGPELAALDRRIHEVLFPNISYESSGDKIKWRNAKCDVQAVWSHINRKADVFVTSDRNFHSHAEQLKELGAGLIAYPQAAAELVRSAGQIIN